MSLPFTRYFSDPDVHPRDEVTWEERSADIKDDDGEVLFEQDGLEFPEHFSQLATKIVASKYFVGSPGMPNGDPPDGREYSLKQMIDRVVDFIVKEGREQGHLDDESAEVFGNELYWLLLNQYGSFNSPVWFNVGLQQAYGLEDEEDRVWSWERQCSCEEDDACSRCDGAVVEGDQYKTPQAAACFIIDVDDSIDGIWEFMQESARLFKYGSGIGADWSTLRSSQETLSAGGTASGPVSFMKVQDTTGGTIKSGGRNRRAAIMQTLKCWHPDIEAFVDAKKKEELKAHALIEEGYDGSFNGEAYDTVQFQNVNQSLRVTDEFMEKARANRSGDTTQLFGLKAVTMEEIVDQVDPSEIIDRVAEGTWVCGDPGLQYEDTIQRWHKCPNTAPINSSNPCVTGDTLVATSDGFVEIQELVGQTPEVVGSDDRVHGTTRVIETGTKPVYELTTKSGFKIQLTGDHKVLTDNRGDVPAFELTKDDRVVLGRPTFGSEDVDNDLALLSGLLLGDGCMSKESEDYARSFVLTMDKDRELAVINRAADITNSLKVNRQGGEVTVQTKTSTADRIGSGEKQLVDRIDDLVVLDKGSHNKRLTPEALRLNKGSIRNILQGLFTADGTVANYGGKSHYISLDSTSETLLEQVQQLLLSFGVKSKIYRNRRAVTEKNEEGVFTTMLPDGKGGEKEYEVKQMHSLRISRSSREVFEEEIGFMPGSRKTEKLAELNRGVSTYRDRWDDKVSSVEYVGDKKVYDLTEPVTDHFVGNGIVTHNCSEYLFLDNSACNLASLNLRKYQRWDGSFRLDDLRRAATIFITAQEILVDASGYPSEAIAKNSHDFRPLGLGFANAGAAVMAAGYPYDSDEGRAIVASLQSIIHHAAELQSARMAGVMGPFEGYAKNEAPALDVLRMHSEAAHDLLDETIENDMPPFIRKAAEYGASLSDDAYRMARAKGLRNAQVTVIAPTGTIGFYMDCDTKGIEPSLGLVSYKTLAGASDSQVKIVNKSVKQALFNLGYSEDEQSSTLDYINENDTIEGAPGLKDEHLPVFDCSFAPMNGDRSIHHMGHIRMMGAVQPFVSGAISKTCNLPEDATVGDIVDAYEKAWELGLKAVAIYRENSKKSQPMNTSDGSDAEEASPEEKAEEALQVIEDLVESQSIEPLEIVKAVDDNIWSLLKGGGSPPSNRASEKTQRRRLPDDRPAMTHKFSVAGHEGYITVGLYPNSTEPGEIFITMSKEGSTLAGFCDSFAIMLSIALQYGVPLEHLVRKLKGIRFEPSGFTGNDDIRSASSIIDYVAQYLDHEFLSGDPNGGWIQTGSIDADMVMLGKI